MILRTKEIAPHAVVVGGGRAGEFRGRSIPSKFCHGGLHWEATRDGIGIAESIRSFLA
jgi:hypothetical protein